ncbi:formyltransferase family protein [Corticicoccus populi]|uniref:Formyltransferase family protein n=1 Tax=Corticicoccus populi TaxID=1812821 RepID=A0ABW5WX76_9STAP
MKNVLFLGRKKWAASALEHLLDSGYTVIGVSGMNDLTGEKRNPLVEQAGLLGIPVYSDDEIYHYIDYDAQTFKGEHIDIVISYLYYHRVRQPLLSIADTAINFHPAILPDYQGLGGYNAAILDGRKEYGVTAHMMIEGFDAGDIIKISKFKMNDNETALSLEQKSMQNMFLLFKEIFSSQYQFFIDNAYFNDITAGRYISRADFEEMKFVDPDASKEEIDRKIRAFWYPPFEGAKMKVGSGYYTLVSPELMSLIEKNTFSQEEKDG